jgi:hypothetical protein
MHQQVLKQGQVESAGWIAVRTSKGEQISGAHKMISSNPNAICLRRYWSIDSVTTTINGKWNFTYNDADLVAPGDEIEFTKIGRWRPVKEQTPGIWAHPFTTLLLTQAQIHFLQMPILAMTVLLATG